MQKQIQHVGRRRERERDVLHALKSKINKSECVDRDVIKINTARINEGVKKHFWG